MSRVGKRPIIIDKSVDIVFNNNQITVSNNINTVSLTVDKVLNIDIKDSILTVTRLNDSKYAKERHGCFRAILNNIVRGLVKKHSRDIIINGVGYRVQAVENGLEFLLGYSHPVFVDNIEGITFTILNPTSLRVEGFDNQLVGQVSANICKLRKYDPYKGKGLYLSTAKLRRKEGKVGKK